MNRRRRHPEVAQAAPQPRVQMLRCIECGNRSGLYARGWRGYRTDDPETDDRPEIGFYCPTCAAREFD